MSVAFRLPVLLQGFAYKGFAYKGFAYKGFAYKGDSRTEKGSS